MRHVETNGKEKKSNSGSKATNFDSPEDLLILLFHFYEWCIYSSISICDLLCMSMSSKKSANEKEALVAISSLSL